MFEQSQVSQLVPSVHPLHTPLSETQKYIHVLILGLFVFAGIYGYLVWQKMPNLLNKAVADTSIILIGLSFLLSSICYFWNFLDFSIVYRKHLGLLGFAFGVVHTGLSFSALQRLFLFSTWQKGMQWPALAGTLALVIFSIMALISNTYAATKLGGVLWRKVLRTGYVAVILIWIHVYLLKSMRWIQWIQGGFKAPPSTSFIVILFMTIVLGMRLALWWSLLKKKRQVLHTSQSSPSLS